MQEILILILLSLTPLIELRGSIPYGIIVGMNPFLVFFVATISNLFLGIIVYYAVIHIIPFFRKWNFFDKLYKKYVLITQKRIHSKVEKYGNYGLAAFIAIPVPGSGVFSGALAAVILGFSFRNFFKASFIGLIIAGAVITVLVVSGSTILGAIK